MLYDSKYGAQVESGDPGYEQLQNDIQTRIKEETIYLRAQANYGSVEDLRKTIEIPRISHFRYQSLPNYNEHTNKIQANALGSMSNMRDEAPAWEINVLQGVITGSTATLTGSATSPVHNIPQLDFQEQEFKSFVNRGDSQFTNFDETCAEERLGFGLGEDVFSYGS